jgi:hypothetical protein
MNEPDEPKERPKSEPVLAARRPAEVVRLDPRLFPEVQPDRLTSADAVRIVRLLATNTNNIVVIPYGKRKAKVRAITRRQIELCVQKGTLTEGPFLNRYGNWQMNVYRHAAGEEITCVVAIEWATRVLVINTF